MACALIVSACGSQSSNSSDASEIGPNGVTGRKIKIAFSAPGADHGWTAAVTTAANAQAAKFHDVDFTSQATTNDSAAQAAQVEALIAQHPDVLVILPNDGAALTPVALKAMQAGIPVVNVDREFTDPAAARATIEGDNYGAGLQAGKYFADQLNCTGNVVEIQGLAGISVTDQRTQGFADGIKKCNGGIKIVAQQPADFNPDKGMSVMTSILQANPKIDAVYTQDDDMAQGVVQAIKNAHRDTQMFVTGIGGSKAAMDQIASGGLYRATFLYSPAMAASAVSLARLIAQDKGMADLTLPDVPNKIVTQSVGVYKSNVDQYRSVAY
jgi:ribose transport system substrate-binding protein